MEDAIILVLTRKKSEKIIVDGPVEITVVRIDGDRVRLGFTGPGGVRRSELLEPQEEKKP